MNYQGDINLEETIDIKFTTVSSTGLPTTLAGTPSVAAYVGNGTTEITAGVTLTVDFDGRTGMHNVRVAATNANGFGAATNVNLVIIAGTVSGNSVVGYVVGSFSIENRSAARPAQVNTEVDTALADAGLTTTVTGRIDASVSSRATQTSVDAIGSKTINLPSDPADASDIAAAFTVTNGKVDAVAAKTDNLPSDPADASIIADQFTDLDGKINTIAGYIDTEVAAIKAKTDQLIFTGGKVDANADIALAAGDLTDIADAILKRDWTELTGEAAYSLLNAARMLRNAWSTAGGVLVVKKEDGTTNAWSRPLAVDPAAEPIVGAS